MFLMIIVAAATGILIGLGLSRLAMFLGMRG